MQNILPNTIDCTLRYNKKPIEGLMLLAEFRTIRKNSYHIVFGPSDREGKASITYEEIKKQADIQLNMALMDYDPIDKAFSGKITIQVMNSVEIKNAIDAYNIFSSVANYPKRYLECLENTLKNIDKIDLNNIEIDSFIRPETGKK